MSTTAAIPLYIFFFFFGLFACKLCSAFIGRLVVEFVSNHLKTLDLIDLINRAGKVGEFQRLLLYIYPMHDSVHISHFCPTTNLHPIDHPSLRTAWAPAQPSATSLMFLIPMCVPIPSSVAMHWSPDSSSVGAARYVSKPTPRPSWYPE